MILESRIGGPNMYEFNINDYIWYIIGGIALLFVVIGFVADKSGLAKKTFSKDYSSSKKTVQKKESSSSIVVEDAPVETSDSQESVVIDDVDTENSSFSDVSTTNEDVDLDDQLSNESVEEPSREPFSVQEPIYLNGDDDSSEQNISFDLNNSALQGDEGDMSNEEDSVWNMDSDEVDIDDENLSVATDDAEEEWGMNLTDSDSVESGEDVEFPNLEDISSNTDEDVWKF